MNNLEKYLIDEMNRHGEFLNETDIAKFIIQTYSGPFHLLKEAPDERVIKKRIIKNYKANAGKNTEKDIFQQIADNVLRLNLIPFIRKYRTADMCTGMFIKNFEHYDISYTEPIDIPDIRSLLASVGILETDSIINIVERYNNDGFVPSHSLEYKDNYHPAYIVVLNDVIKEYITLL